MKNCLVSVVMATYNDRIEYLQKAIDSILTQTYSNFEFIIIDDSNNIKTINYLESKAQEDNRIKFIHNPSKLGFVKSLNLGLKLSSGKYIARMDSDDISCQYRLEKQVQYLETHEEISILGGNIIIIDEHGNSTGERKYKTSFEEISKTMFYRNPLAHPTVMYRKSILGKIGYYDETFSMAEDYEMWLRAIKMGLIVENIDEVLVNYRMADDYHTKRSYKNWKFNLLAKVKNFNYRYLGRNSLGIVMTVALMVAPSSVLRRLYESDKKKSFMYK